MAQIDLRNATIKIKDGYTVAGFLVNNVANYAIGAVTMLVDGGAGALQIYDWFTVVGDTVEHQITAHTETLSNTTSITFTPALAGAVLDDAIITILPHAIEVNISEGNLTYDEKRAFKYIKNRGRLDTVRQEDDEPVEVKLDAIWEFIRAYTSEPPTIEDALKQRGQAALWITSSSDTCETYAVDIEIYYDAPCSGVQNERITLSDFRYESFSHDLRQGMFQVSGKCNVTEGTVSRG